MFFCFRLRVKRSHDLNLTHKPASPQCVWHLFFVHNEVEQEFRRLFLMARIMPWCILGLFWDFDHQPEPFLYCLEQKLPQKLYQCLYFCTVRSATESVHTQGTRALNMQIHTHKICLSNFGKTHSHKNSVHLSLPLPNSTHIHKNALKFWSGSLWFDIPFAVCDCADSPASFWIHSYSVCVCELILLCI